MEIIGYILVVVISIGLSPILKGLVNKFVEESEIEEKEEEKRTPAKKSKKEIKKVKVKFVPEFDWKMTAVTVLAEIILFINLGITMQFFIYAFLTLLLVMCMFADIKGYIIPNEINFVGFLVGIVLAFVKMNFSVQAGLDAISGMLVGVLVFLGIAGLSLLIFKREGMGGGDIKLMGVIGLYLGFFNNIQVFILSFFIAAIISIFLLATKIKKSDDYIPFGPFIVLAAYITMLFPASVIMPNLLQLLN
ncbi:MAG: prepilin peptidase [Clostridia bacterium]|nr:prepilin peptidase [Clostridia bacterium]